MSIKIKFTLLIIIFIIILVTILSYISLTNQKKLLLKETDKKIKTLLINTSETIKEGLISADDLLISSTIQKLKKRNEDIKDAYILDNKGILLFHSDDNIIKKVLINNKLNLYKNKFYKKILVKNSFFKMKKNKYLTLYSYPIIDNNVKLGTLFIEFNNKRLLEELNNIKKKIILISLLILIIFIGITYLFTSFLLKPVKELMKGVKIIGSGNLDHQIKISQKDELGELAINFNKMTKELKKSRQRIIEQELLEKDLHIAKEIQSFLIPEIIPDIKGLDIGRYYHPAHFVGGDYYDIIKIGENKYGIIIIDVSGKGSGAAIIMAVITFIFHSEATKTFNTAELMKNLNNKLHERIPAGRYATGIYLIYDAKREIFQYTNAGHNNILFYQNKSNKIYELSKATSMPIGIAKDIEYENVAYRLGKGDILLLQTDGIYEAMNKKREEFSLERVKESLIKYSSLENANAITENIIKDVNNFVNGARQHDDMTLITIRKK